MQNTQAKTVVPAQTLSAAAQKLIQAKASNNGGGGHCQGGGSW